MDGITFRIDGQEEMAENMRALANATQRNVARRVLTKAAQPVAERAASLAPVERGILAFSIVVSTQLTRRHKAEQRNRESEVEVYIGPAGGQGALFYASHVEFGTVLAPARPYLRPAWESTKGEVMALIASGLRAEIERAASRGARKAARHDSNAAMIRERLGGA